MSDDNMPALRPEPPSGMTTPDGTYYMWVRFDRSYHDDIAMPVAQRHLHDGKPVGYALREQFLAELLAGLTEDAPRAFSLLYAITASKDPASVFAPPTGKDKGVTRVANPWTLMDFMSVAKDMARRLRDIHARLGVVTDNAFNENIERVLGVEFNDIAGADGAAIEKERALLEEKYEKLLEVVVTTRDALKSTVFDVNEALPHELQQRRTR